MTSRRGTRRPELPPAQVEELLKHLTARLSQLGVRGWLRELTRLWEMSLNQKFDWHADNPKVRVIDIDGRKRVFLPGAPVAQLVEPHARRRTIPKHLLPAIVINIDAPDKVVLAEFRRSLREARERHPPPFQRAGPTKEDATLPWNATFRRWRDYHIAELAELFAWRLRLSIEERRRYPDNLLGQWLGMNRNQTSRAKNEVLPRAIASLPLLAAQLKYGREPEDVTPDQVEANADLSDEDHALAAQLLTHFRGE